MAGKKHRRFMADFKHPNHGVEESSLAVQPSWMFFFTSMGSGWLTHHIMYPYYGGLECYGLGGLKLKTQQNRHATIQWFKKKQLCSVAVLSGFSTIFPFGIDYNLTFCYSP